MAGRTSKAATGTGGRFAEIGVAGLKVNSGYVDEEFLTQLRGPRGIKIYREMSDNDDTVGGVLRAVDLLVRAADWKVEPAENTPQAEEGADFVDGCLKDMAHSWEDFISEALSMLPYGWSYHEIVWKRRLGPDQADPTKRSKYDDGKIGIRKLAPRAQDSLSRWELQDDGGIEGMWQLPWNGGGERMIPLDKALLFRTTSRLNSPEGISILRTAYRSWYYLKQIQNAEAIGIERDLAGLPVVKIPSKYLRADATATDKAILATYQKIARDLKFNEQGGLVIPSDPYFDGDDKPTSIAQVSVELLSTAGQRTINTNDVARRYQTGIARSMLAAFIMLGTDGSGKGSFALSKDQSDLFLRACETFLWQIATVINRFLIPRLWRINGFDRATMPTLQGGRIGPVDLAEIGAFIRDITSGGMPLFPDQSVEDHLKEISGLPINQAEAM